MAEIITQSKKARLIFIDVMRGIAVLWMIETHVVDALLLTKYKAGLFYDYLNISNGMVSVAFLFCAGAGFWLATQRKGDEYRQFKPSFWLYLRRLGFILMMGYWLHMPVLSFAKLMNLTYTDFIKFMQCDILQVIVISSLLAVLLLLMIPKTKILPYIFIAIALGAFYSAPLMLAYEPMKHMPHYIGVFFATFPVSKFPLLHWSGYFFAGAALTAFLYRVENKRKFAIYASIGTIITLIVVFFIKSLPFTYPGYPDWWRCSPGHAIYRTSVVSLAFFFLYLIEDWYKNKKFTQVLVISGQESLYLYIFHLMIVYGSIVNPGLKIFVNARLEPMAVIILIIMICAFCYITAKVWHRIKEQDSKLAMRVMWTVAILFAAIFMVNPL